MHRWDVYTYTYMSIMKSGSSVEQLTESETIENSYYEYDSTTVMSITKPCPADKYLPKTP